ncbi:MAG: SLAP domain-containing protein [Lactobacillus sp.]
MKKNRLLLFAAAALLGVAPLAMANGQNNTVQAADTSVRKTIMHTAIAYDKDGNSTGQKYYAYNSVMVDSTPVTIDGGQYYKISGKDQYIKITNIDGVKRKITHNTYIYRTSTGRTSYNGRWKLYKGETITTYGGSYKFKNGKHYFRVGGPSKQYVKSYNLGPIIGTNTSSNSATNKTDNSSTNKKNSSSTNAEETTVTVTAPTAALFVVKDDYSEVQPSNKVAKKGDTFTVDRLEQGTRAGTGSDGDDDGELAIYHIKGTNYWIYNNRVKAAKQLPVQQFYRYKTSWITMDKPVEVFNADGTSQNIIIKKNDTRWRVDSLSYIWVAKDNKAELLYRLHLNGQYRNVYRVNADGSRVSDWLPIKNAYVKASDVKVDPDGTTLTPSNTPEQAKAAAQNK